MDYQTENMRPTVVHRPDAPHDSPHAIFTMELLKLFLKRRYAVILLRLRRIAVFSAFCFLRPSRAIRRGRRLRVCTRVVRAGRVEKVE